MMPSFEPGKLGNDVGHGHVGGSFGDKRILFHLSALQFPFDVGADLLNGLAAVPARPEGDNLFGVLHGTRSVNMKCWADRLDGFGR